MQAKKVLLLFSVMLALASAAAIGVMLPEGYPTPPATAPEQSVPAAPQAPVPLAPAPGHPGGIYTQVVMTVYGPLKITNVSVDGSKVFSANRHVAPDNLSAMTSFVADTRDEVYVTFNITDRRDDINTAYVTLTAPAGVEAALIKVNGDPNNKFHVSPGVWLVKLNGKNNENTLTFKIYGHPISSGDRSISITVTAQ